tara:strand:- start:593 stop:985 length:393 start_codon:yes stop_codon:yes gene_type:complete
MVEMPDNTKTVMLTEREIDLVLQCIGTNIETVKRRHPVTGSTADLIQELIEMDMDIREQAFRDDGWDTPAIATFPVKEEHTIKRAIDPAERGKFASAAQERRILNSKKKVRTLSETQAHDVWDDTDPRNW